MNALASDLTLDQDDVHWRLQDYLRTVLVSVSTLGDVFPEKVSLENF